MPTKCFLLERTNIQRVYLRRYSDRQNVCSALGSYGYHDVRILLTECPAIFDDEERILLDHGIPKPAADDPIWPTACRCGYEFKDTDRRMLLTNELYKRQDTGELLILRDAPPGAMWNSWWIDNDNPDGQYLTVKLPTGHEWDIDGQANNCTNREDTVHRCWIRHGIAPNITVDKNGNTCQAGAGSIMVPGYHGHLRDGYLTDSV
jgi:hypothetical protein